MGGGGGGGGGEPVLPTSTTWDRVLAQLIFAESLKQQSLCGPGCVVGHVWTPAPVVPSRLCDHSRLLHLTDAVMSFSVMLVNSTFANNLRPD